MQSVSLSICIEDDEWSGTEILRQDHCDSEADARSPRPFISQLTLSSANIRSRRACIAAALRCKTTSSCNLRSAIRALPAPLPRLKPMPNLMFEPSPALSRDHCSSCRYDRMKSCSRCMSGAGMRLLPNFCSAPSLSWSFSLSWPNGMDALACSRVALSKKLPELSVLPLPELASAIFGQAICCQGVSVVELGGRFLANLRELLAWAAARTTLHQIWVTLAMEQSAQDPKPDTES